MDEQRHGCVYCMQWIGVSPVGTGSRSRDSLLWEDFEPVLFTVLGIDLFRNNIGSF